MRLLGAGGCRGRQSTTACEYQSRRGGTRTREACAGTRASVTNSSLMMTACSQSSAYSATRPYSLRPLASLKPSHHLRTTPARDAAIGIEQAVEYTAPAPALDFLVSRYLEATHCISICHVPDSAGRGHATRPILLGSLSAGAARPGSNRQRDDLQRGCDNRFRITPYLLLNQRAARKGGYF